MTMNLYILFLVSLPEASLNIILILLFVGERDRLKINRANIIRFVIALSATLLFSNFVRPLVPNAVVNVSAHVVAYIIIIKIVYNLNIVYTLLGAMFVWMVGSIIENLYFPFIIAYISKGIDNYARDYHLYVLYAMPYRICQLALLRFFWKNQILLVTRISRILHKYFIAVCAVMIIMEYSIGYLFYSYFDRMALFHQILLSVSLFIMGILFNLLIFKFIYHSVRSLITGGYRQYRELEENVEFAFDEIEKMLEQNKIAEAMQLIHSLKGKEKSI